MNRHFFALTLASICLSSAALAGGTVTLELGKSAPTCKGKEDRSVLTTEEFKKLFGPNAACKEGGEPVYYLCKLENQFRVACEKAE